ncbi:MAG TPA: ABC transporter permease [Bryobacteraceae bacterium]|nr:ABC transporter permease [Bryobacteraceae bacterium]
MTWVRRVAVVILVVVALGALFGPVFAPYSYGEQFRDAPSALPGGRFLLGTDQIGRDYFSRLLYATRISIVLAPAAALVSILLALLIAPLGAGRRLLRPVVSVFTTICLALPWIFLFIILRAELPLNTSPILSVLATFALMGVAGWAWPARVFAAEIGRMENSGWLLHARACGIPSKRIATVHAWPHLRSVALAQFRVLVPAYILAEASLGLLGLGVPEPLPSWGNLLSDLRHPDLVRANPWILTPLVLLILVMICLETLGSAPMGEIE